MKVETATVSDTDRLVRARIDYLTEDLGGMKESDRAAILEMLPEYFGEHLNRDIFCYVIRDGEEIVSCAFLLVVEKPMSPSFLNGRTGIVLNVYTRPEYRHRGYAKKIIQEMLRNAEKMQLSRVELKATDEGYHLYRAAGFEDDGTKYHNMKWIPFS